MPGINPGMTIVGEDETETPAEAGFHGVCRYGPRVSPGVSLCRTPGLQPRLAAAAVTAARAAAEDVPGDAAQQRCKNFRRERLCHGKRQDRRDEDHQTKSLERKRSP